NLAATFLGDDLPGLGSNQLADFPKLTFRSSEGSARVNLVVQDNTQQGLVDVDFAVVLDEAQLPEFVHEEIDPGPRRANHLRQHLLRYFGKHVLRMSRGAKAPEQQQSAH